MAKLPPSFVKAPPAESAAKPRRARKPSLVGERDVREILLRLDETEYRALEDARETLHRAGEDVTLEQMVHRVLTGWAKPRVAPEPERRDEGVIDRLRAFAAAPLRTWRELGAALRRMARLPAH